MAVNTVQAIINGQTYNLTRNSSTGKYEATITAPATSSYPLDGHYYPVTVKASDTAGNQIEVDDNDTALGSSLRLRVQEKVAPISDITSPTAGQLTSNNKPEITWTVTDNDSGVNPDSIKLSIDNVQVSGTITKQAISGGYSCSYTPDTALDDGEHTVSVAASDNDGNAAAAESVTFEVLATAPNLFRHKPGEQQLSQGCFCAVCRNDERSDDDRAGRIRNCAETFPFPAGPSAVH